MILLKSMQPIRRLTFTDPCDLKSCMQMSYEDITSEHTLLGVNKHLAYTSRHQSHFRSVNTQSASSALIPGPKKLSVRERESQRLIRRRHTIHFNAFEEIEIRLGRRTQEEEDSSEDPSKPRFHPEPPVSGNPPRHRFVSFGSKPSLSYFRRCFLVAMADRLLSVCTR